MGWPKRLCKKWRSWCWKRVLIEGGTWCTIYFGVEIFHNIYIWLQVSERWIVTVNSSCGQVGPLKHQSHLSFYFLRFGSLDLSWNYTTTQQWTRDTKKMYNCNNPFPQVLYIFWQLQIRKGLNHSIQIACHQSPEINAQNGCFPLLHFLNQDHHEAMICYDYDHVTAWAA